ncbi:hypothetical protein N7532_004970 [Penicillium argentinense]|uniref:Zn(2)-C6 fungal-type domain-containing protein n=1 Tax=Penicillium argentinense TaxID=1131581 RepID=A0A9W9FDA6_9EURO|nr:uncharacterized protein N7532_004970 [Penicillium argentinense]KAJ5097969.1 hypothetical protein N7532_004970 [Penicillium argentinense]
MVFRGKPSPGCGPCRQRRIKCDLGIPSCTQCLKVQNKCYGYRDRLDLMFLHQTDNVTPKANPCSSSGSKSRYSKSYSGKSEEWNNATGHGDIMTPPQMQQLVEPLTSRAINLFMFAFSGGVYLEYLPAIYGYHERPASLQTSLEAVALAYLAKVQGRTDLRQMALKTYGIALTLTNLAVRSLAATEQLETATSVLLLALFAVILPRSSTEARDTWSKHVQGALAVLASCNTPEIFDSLSGQSILHHVISTTQIDSINRCKPLPPQLQCLFSVSWLSCGPQVQLWSLIDRISMLNASFSPTSISLSYLSDIQFVDDEIENLLRTMPQAYQSCFEFEEDESEAIQLPVKGGVKRIPFQIFKSHRLAQTWNTLRILRLFNTELLASAASAYLSSVTNDIAAQASLVRLLERATEVATRTSLDICATVPEPLRPRSILKNNPMGIPTDDSAWARSLVWPLSLAKASAHHSDVLRDYIEKQLQILISVPGMCELYMDTPTDSFSVINW